MRMEHSAEQLMNGSPAAQLGAVEFGIVQAQLTRFAPSPTGELHLGHVLHMEWLWTAAAASGARVIVRSEDHDRTRSTTEYEEAILADMEWLGHQPDQQSLASLRSGFPSPYRQSDCPERYAAAVERLHDMRLTYYCDCTRSMLTRRAADGERFYPGTCRSRGLGPGEGRQLRVRLPDDQVMWTDVLRGPFTQHPAAEHGDPVIADSRGQWTYQLCVVVDDIAHGVDLIVRGEDIMPSTGRQILLARVLGSEATPAYIHHPLLLAANGTKLSKRDRSETVSAMRLRGMTAPDIRAAALTS
jgi:glutamyl/glutaminyl-tRNA synthetase